MRPKILVIGATGKHGNTGAIVVDRLISHGRDVRMLTRTDDRRVDALRQRGFAWLPNSHGPQFDWWEDK
jgi:uncharacterized protein YbjT (DUF2867 family)